MARDNTTWSLADVSGGSIVVPVGWHSPTIYLTTNAPPLKAENRVTVDRTLCVGFTRWDMYVVAFAHDMQVREVGWLEWDEQEDLLHTGAKLPYGAKDVVKYNNKLYVVVNNPGTHPHHGTKVFLDMSSFTFEKVSIGEPVVGSLQVEEHIYEDDLFKETDVNCLPDLSGVAENIML